MQRFSGWLVVALSGVASVLAMAAHFEIGLNNDNQVLLDQTRLWLQGRELYTALVAPSPPMIFALYAPPVAANLAIGLPLPLGFDLWTTALLLSSLVLCYHILWCHPEPPARRSRWLILSLIGLCLTLLPLRDNVFGDREHLFLVLFTPYLLRLSPFGAASELRRPAQALVALSAAVGLGIKPYFLAIWAMQQAYWIWRQRSLSRVPCRFETLLVAAAYGTYLLAIGWATPEYPFTVAPLAWESYSAISPPLAHRQAMLLRSWQTVLGLPLAGAALLVLARSLPVQRSVGYLLFLALGANASGFAGGWHYAYFPLYAIASAFTASVVAGLLASARDAWPHARALAGGCLLAGALLCAMPLYSQLARPAVERGALDREFQRRTGWPWAHQRPHPEVELFLDRHLDALAQTRFLLLGNGMWDSNLVELEPSRTSVSRFYTLWPLPAVVSAEPGRADRIAWIRRYLYDAVTEDVRAQRPDLVFIERSRGMWGLPAGFDVLGFFLRHPPFADAWREYTLVERIDRCPGMPRFCAFDVYYRNDLLAKAPAGAS